MLQKSPDLRRNVQIIDLDSLVPKEHLLRKIEKAIDFKKIYNMLEQYYSHDTGRPTYDPVVLVKMVLIQHLYAIKSLRQTVKDIDMNIAYRWFLGFDLTTPLPHFATISYAFAQRFPSEVFEEIFCWILEEVVKRNYVDASIIFIDASHIKANANKKKNRKEQVQETARIYESQLREEINQDRVKNNKKAFKDDDVIKNRTKEITVSRTDPESGLFHKGEHKVEFAYSAHVACDKNNFIIQAQVTAGNHHDSTAFDEIYENATKKFPESEIIALDAGYKTPWICKKIIDDKRKPSMPYKRPQSKKGFIRSYEYIYDEYYNSVICPEKHILKYSTTNKDGYREYKSDPKVCINCNRLKECTHSKTHQKTVQKHIWSNYVDKAEDIRHTEEGKASYQLRKETIERVFADAKEKHGMRYTLYRGLSRVGNWLKLKFAAMNLKKLAMWAY